MIKHTIFLSPFSASPRDLIPLVPPALLISSSLLPPPPFLSLVPSPHIRTSLSFAPLPSLPAFRLLLRRKSTAFRLASLALPLSVTSESASVTFRQIRWQFICFKKTASFPFVFNSKIGAFRLASLVVPMSVQGATVRFPKIRGHVSSRAFFEERVVGLPGKRLLGARALAAYPSNYDQLLAFQPLELPFLLFSV